MKNLISLDHTKYFDQAAWEQQSTNLGITHSRRSLQDVSREDNQFILLQLSDSAQGLDFTTQVDPSFVGSPEMPDINMRLDFESFKIGSNEGVDKNTKATLQLKIGQEEKVGSLDKLFYCINGGLNLYNEIKGKKASAADFKKSTQEAMGYQAISIPKGIGQISLKVLKHQEPKWWQKVFTFAKTDTAKELFSLIGFPGITQLAANSIGNMIENLFDKEPEVLFESLPIKLGFNQTAKSDLQGGLSNIMVSCLKPGLWIMARKSDVKEMIANQPAYLVGHGLLVPKGMNELEALTDSSNNPFSKMTYAVISAKMKEVNLKQGLLE